MMGSRGGAENTLEPGRTTKSAFNGIYDQTLMGPGFLLRRFLHRAVAAPGNAPSFLAVPCSLAGEYPPTGRAVNLNCEWAGVELVPSNAKTTFAGAQLHAAPETCSGRFCQGVWQSRIFLRCEVPGKG